LEAHLRAEFSSPRGVLPEKYNFYYSDQKYILETIVSCMVKFTLATLAILNIQFNRHIKFFYHQIFKNYIKKLIEEYFLKNKTTKLKYQLMNRVIFITLIVIESPEMDIIRTKMDAIYHNDQYGVSF
jgi:hypothetical protein